MAKKIGRQTVVFDGNIFLSEGFVCAGKKEAEGPLGNGFDQTFTSDRWDEDSFEKCERKMFLSSMSGCISKAGLMPGDIDLLLGGDLLNQNISASFTALSFPGSFLGLYNACSTMAEGLFVGSCIMDSGAARRVLCLAGSHFATAERQYRFPLEMGSLRTPTAQWTVTAAAGALLSDEGDIRLKNGTAGRVLNAGITDANNMGAAMAPAACDTIIRHLRATETSPEDYDGIFTGDLGSLGLTLLEELALREGVHLHGHVSDCGCMIFSKEQNIDMGGSGCGCGAAVLCSDILARMREGQLKRVLFVATGALLSPTSTLQGESIPSIAHAVSLEKQ